MGYWFYANATKDREAFDGRLDFELTLVPYKGNTDWVEGTLINLKACLESTEIPPAGADCDYCRYREAAGKALHKIWQDSTSEKTQARKSKIKVVPHEEITGHLF